MSKLKLEFLLVSTYYISGYHIAGMHYRVRDLWMTKRNRKGVNDAEHICLYMKNAQNATAYYTITPFFPLCLLVLIPAVNPLIYSHSTVSYNKSQFVSFAFRYILPLCQSQKLVPVHWFILQRKSIRHWILRTLFLRISITSGTTRKKKQVLSFRQDKS